MCHVLAGRQHGPSLSSHRPNARLQGGEGVGVGGFAGPAGHGTSGRSAKAPPDPATTLTARPTD